MSTSTARKHIGIISFKVSRIATRDGLYQIIVLFQVYPRELGIAIFASIEITLIVPLKKDKCCIAKKNKSNFQNPQCSGFNKLIMDPDLPCEKKIIRSSFNF